MTGVGCGRLRISCSTGLGECAAFMVIGLDGACDDVDSETPTTDAEVGIADAEEVCCKRAIREDAMMLTVLGS
jgi:hypothetical protein